MVPVGFKLGKGSRRQNRIIEFSGVDGSMCARARKGEQIVKSW